MYVDPFFGGGLLTPEEVFARIAETTGRPEAGLSQNAPQPARRQRTDASLTRSSVASPSRAHRWATNSSTRIPSWLAAMSSSLRARSAASAERAKACTPGYYNREGQANAKTRQGSFFFGSPTEYADILAASRANGSPEGFEVT